MNTTTLSTPAASMAMLSMFHSAEAFHLLQEQALYISKSDLLPDSFKGKPENCGIAMEIAMRLGAGFFQVVQNLVIIHGRPTFSATFLMAMINASNRFSPLEYEMTIDGEEKTIAIEYSEKVGFGANAKYETRKLNYTYVPTTCRAMATNLRTGKEVYGPPVSYDLAIHEGWVAKSGSKWLGPMRELMLTYRAGSFFSRVHASDMTLGMRTTDEAVDAGPTIEVYAEDVTTRLAAAPSTANPHQVATAAPSASSETAEKPKTRRSAKAEAAPAPAATPAPEPAKAAEKGFLVKLNEVTVFNGENTKGKFQKFTLKYLLPDGSSGEAATFVAAIVEPLENAEAGTKLRIETEANPNPKYAPKLVSMSIVSAPDAAPAATGDGVSEESPWRD